LLPANVCHNQSRKVGEFPVLESEILVRAAMTINVPPLLGA
jgi:hypothetical protein